MCTSLVIIAHSHIYNKKTHFRTPHNRYVWDLSKLNNKEEENNGLSTPSRRFRVFGRGEKELPITFMNVSKDGHYLALGFANGRVRLFYGKNVLEDNSWGLSIGMSNDAPAFVNLSHGTSNAVSNLHFTSSTLFVVHSASSSSSSKDDEEEVGVIAYNIPSSSELAAPSTKDSVVLEQRGSSCATLGFALGSKTQNHLAVGMDEAVYFFSKDDRGQCYALGSKKRELSWYRRYLLILYNSKDGKDGDEEEEDDDMHNVLAAYDLGNRLVSAHVRLPNNESVRCVRVCISLVNVYDLYNSRVTQTTPNQTGTLRLTSTGSPSNPTLDMVQSVVDSSGATS